tara:strand:+ start:305869 stop:307560 length:1692 start_codon:yes stop_codon:yes gene_type:complete
MDIKRTILWIVFSFSLLLLWNSYNEYTGQTSIFAPTPTAKKTEDASVAATPDTNSTTATANGADVPTASVAATGSAPAGGPASKGELITITTDLVEAQIDTAGGEIRHLTLLKHKADGEDATGDVVLFNTTAPNTYLGQTGLTGGAYPNHKSMYVAKPGVRTLGDGNQVQLVLEAEQQGVKLIKTFTFKRDSYQIDIKHDVVNNSGATITPSLYMQLVRDDAKLDNDSMFQHSAYAGPVVYTDAEKFQKVSFSDIDGGKPDHVIKADNGWIAMVQHYFVAAFVPPAGVEREIFTKKLGANLYAIGDIVPMGAIPAGASKTIDAALYAGPQESTRLDEVAPGFDLVKDYGLLTVIGKPIFWLMTQIHQMLGNWGWTIIVLTIVIKLVFFPLSAAGYRSMARMKLVSPKMTDIRARHKGDPQKMNAAMMELYKTEKINPIGGCFPMLVQIPVFLALYYVLQASIEIRGAPWIGWIHNLAAPDPYFILPVLMAVSMFVQTKLNPTPPDPIQAKIMMFMPIAFSIMFFFFPSGLVLYWVTNNILSIAQQWVITNKLTNDKQEKLAKS